MNREILFRGKRQYTGEWAESVCPLGVMHAGHLCDDFDPATVGQYTGLKDKNGKQIFEGDIVNFKTTAYSFNRCYIRWHEKTAQFVLTERNFIRTYPIDRGWEFEIIGNIHDNPELLKGGADGRA